MLRRLALACLAVGLPACSKDSPTTSTAPPPTTLPARSVISVAFDPTPVIALPSSDPARPFRAMYTMIFRETAGLACNVNLWTETYFNPVTGLRSNTVQFGAGDVVRLGGTNHLPASGTLRLTRDVNYSPGGTSGTGRAIDVEVAVQVIDANGNTINATGTVRVQ